MSIFEMLKKSNWYCPFKTAIPLMQNLFIRHVAWGVLCVVLSVVLLFMDFAGEEMMVRVAFSLVPFVIGMFFLFMAFRVYLIIRTGQYQVIEGPCTESPRGINPLPMVGNYMKNMSLTFTMSDEGGIIAYTVRTTRKSLPREGDRVTIAVPLDSLVEDSPTEYQVLSFLSIRYVSHRSVLRKDASKQNARGK